MKGVLSTIDLDDASLVAKAKASPGLVGRDLVREVVPAQQREWRDSLGPWHDLSASCNAEADDSPAAAANRQPHVVALDYGMKWNIPRHLRERGCRVTVLPGTATAADVLAHNPDGVFLSNGPGDPEPLDYAIDTIRGVLGKKPVFGICLGHQLLVARLRGEDVQAQVRPPRRESAGEEPRHRPGRDHRRRITASRSTKQSLPAASGSDAPQPERQHDRRRAAPQRCRRSACSITPKRRPGPHDSHYLFRQFRKMMD